MPRRRIVIIEAPGKRSRIAATLRELGMDAEVLATRGHLCSMPDRLSPLGIDASCRETLRGPRDPALYDSLAAACTGADVHVMTDPDAEGDVIAWDVAEMAAHAGAATICRIRAHGLDAASLRRAFERPCPVDPMDAVPGRTRAIIDRMVGSLSHDGVSIGRVATALLGTMDTMKARGRLAGGEVTLALPAVHGLPFTVTLAAESAEQAEHLIAAAAHLEPVDAAARRLSIAGRPHDMGSLMMAAATELGIEPLEAADLLQELYQEGRASYPRTDARSFGKDAAATASRMARGTGIRWSADALPVHQAGLHAHEALHLLTPVEVASNIAVLPPKEQIAVLIARAMVAAGAMTTVEAPDTTRLPDWARSLAWQRPVGRVPAWLVAQKPPGWRPWSTQTAALNVMLATGLGRPSTWPRHAGNLAERGLLDESFQPTRKGRRWLARSPKDLKTLDFATDADMLIDHPVQSLRLLGYSEAAIGSMSVEDMAAAIAGFLAAATETTRKIKLDAPGHAAPDDPAQYMGASQPTLYAPATTDRAMAAGW